METGRQILVVEDDPDIRNIIQITLQRVPGWSVLLAETGTNGLELVKSESPDAVLLDVMLPGLNGPDVFAEIQAGASTKGIPVIFLTAKAHAQELRRLEALGSAGVLSKPFSPIELRKEIAELLGWEADLSAESA